MATTDDSGRGAGRRRRREAAGPRAAPGKRAKAVAGTAADLEAGAPGALGRAPGPTGAGAVAAALGLGPLLQRAGAALGLAAGGPADEPDASDASDATAGSDASDATADGPEPAGSEPELSAGPAGGWLELVPSSVLSGPLAQHLEEADLCALVSASRHLHRLKVSSRGPSTPSPPAGCSGSNPPPPRAAAARCSRPFPPRGTRRRTRRR